MHPRGPRSLRSRLGRPWSGSAPAGSVPRAAVRIGPTDRPTRSQRPRSRCIAISMPRTNPVRSRVGSGSEAGRTTTTDLCSRHSRKQLRGGHNNDEVATHRSEEPARPRPRTSPEASGATCSWRSRMNLHRRARSAMPLGDAAHRETPRRGGPSWAVRIATRSAWDASPVYDVCPVSASRAVSFFPRQVCWRCRFWLGELLAMIGTAEER
jgi:hypothetical protein